MWYLLTAKLGESHKPEWHMPFKGTNLFAQIIDLADRPAFHQIVRKYAGDWRAKGFSCWDQFVSMLFCQLGKAQSLREICGGLASSTGKLNHLGLSAGPRRTTLAYANEHRPWKIYQEMFYHLLDHARTYEWGKHKLRFKNKLFSMDATVIDLSLGMFNWAHFRRAKGAVKLHLVLDHEGYLPTFAHITEGKVPEVRAANRVITEDFPFPAGSIVVFDKGYTDLGLYNRWCEEDVTFVTRLKENARYDVVRRLTCPHHRGVLRDEIIVFRHFRTHKKCPHQLRRIEVWDAENEQTLVFLTNHLTFGATTIAAIYKERWQIEIFFKLIKQNLRIKTFVGTSLNALQIQIWTALIAILLLKILKLKSTFAWSMSNLVAMLRFNLFTYRDLWEWLNEPFQTPPGDIDSLQLSFFPTALGQHTQG